LGVTTGTDADARPRRGRRHGDTDRRLLDAGGDGANESLSLPRRLQSKPEPREREGRQIATPKATGRLGFKPTPIALPEANRAGILAMVRAAAQ